MENVFNISICKYLFPYNYLDLSNNTVIILNQFDQNDIHQMQDEKKRKVICMLVIQPFL